VSSCVRKTTKGCDSDSDAVGLHKLRLVVTASFSANIVGISADISTVLAHGWYFCTSLHIQNDIKVFSRTQCHSDEGAISFVRSWNRFLYIYLSDICALNQG
jgi:hypothetical protein